MQALHATFPLLEGLASSQLRPPGAKKDKFPRGWQRTRQACRTTRHASPSQAFPAYLVFLHCCFQGSKPCSREFPPVLRRSGFNPLCQGPRLLPVCHAIWLGFNSLWKSKKTSSVALRTDPGSSSPCALIKDCVWAAPSLFICYSLFTPGDPLPAADARCWPATSRSSRPCWLSFETNGGTRSPPPFCPGVHPGVILRQGRQSPRVSLVTSCDTRAGAIAQLQRPSGPHRSNRSQLGPR